MKQYQSSKLKNGLTVVTSEDKNSEVVTLLAYVRAGSRYEKGDELGYAHLLEHMLLKGTKSRPSMFELNVTLDRAGAYSNAATSSEWIGIYIEVSKEAFEEIFEVFTDIITDPLISPDVLENEKKVVIQEIRRAYDNHPKHLVIESLKSVFSGHPLSQLPLGNEESVRAATAERLRDYHNRFFVPNNMAIIACGGITHEGVVTLSEKYLGNLSQAKVSEVAETTSPNPQSGHKHITAESKQTHLVFYFSGPRAEFRDAVALQVLANYLGYKHTSLLYQELRSGRGLAYAISANVLFDSDVTLLKVQTSSTQPGEVIAATKDLLLKLNEHFTEDVFREYRDQFVNVTKRRSADAFTEANILASNWLLYGDMLTPQDVVEVAEKLTFEDMQRIQRTFLTKENLHITTLGPEETSV